MVDVSAPHKANQRGEATPAQERVLHELARGHKFTAIADTLGISCRTVEQHVQQLRKCTGSTTLFQLGMWYGRRYNDQPPQRLCDAAAECDYVF